jgi:predicted ester cyclase
MPEDNVTVLRRAVRRWNEGDLPGYLELYAADAVLHGYEGVEPGLEDIRRFYEVFWVAFPGGQLSLDDVISEGDEVACRFTLRATHRGEFNGMPPTGRQVTRMGITILRFTGGRCVERWSQTDHLGLMQQLGAVPEHAA